MKREHGQSAIEFALTAPFMILIFLAAVQIMLAVYGLSAVNNAARHGARAGSVSQGCAACDAVAAAQAAIQGTPLVHGATVSVLAPGGVTGSILKIRVSADVPVLMPGSSLIDLSSLTHFQAEATFRQEGW